MTSTKVIRLPSQSLKALHCCTLQLSQPTFAWQLISLISEAQEILRQLLLFIQASRRQICFDYIPPSILSLIFKFLSEIELICLKTACVQWNVLLSSTLCSQDIICKQREMNSPQLSLFSNPWRIRVNDRLNAWRQWISDLQNCQPETRQGISFTLDFHGNLYWIASGGFPNTSILRQRLKTLSLKKVRELQSYEIPSFQDHYEPVLAEISELARLTFETQDLKRQLAELDPQSLIPYLSNQQAIDEIKQYGRLPMQFTGLADVAKYVIQPNNERPYGRLQSGLSSSNRKKPGNVAYMEAVLNVAIPRDLAKKYPEYDWAPSLREEMMEEYRIQSQNCKCIGDRNTLALELVGKYMKKVSELIGNNETMNRVYDSLDSVKAEKIAAATLASRRKRRGPQVPNRIMPSIRQCSSCSKVGNLLQCNRCLTVFYCDAACQKKHWPSHKTFCQKH